MGSAEWVLKKRKGMLLRSFRVGPVVDVVRKSGVLGERKRVGMGWVASRACGCGGVRVWVDRLVSGQGYWECGTCRDQVLV
jgi:hypothetical protein